MHDLEVPASPDSPRKKVKLENPLSNGMLADSSAEASEVSDIIPHHDTATANHELSKPTPLHPVDISSVLETPITDVQISTAPTAASEARMEDLLPHSETSSEVVNGKAMNASESQSADVNNAGALDDNISKEAAYGITEFVSPDLLGFSGILKKRYTDFLVNEILPSGEVLHFGDFKNPPKSHKNTELSRDAGQASSANGTVREADTSSPTAKSKEVGQTKGVGQEKSETVPRIALTDDVQTVPYPDTSNSEDPASGNRVNLSETEVSHPIPESMQDFNKHDLAPDLPGPKEETIPPHKRIPSPAPTLPVSMQDTHDRQPEEKQEKVTRHKEKVHIRQTSHGWVEFDKEKEDELQNSKGQDDAAAGLPSEKDTKAVDVEEERAPEASTQASWQAFANSAPSSSSGLQPEDKTTLLSYFSPSIVEEILALHDRVVNSPNRKPKDYGMVTSGVIDRQKRTTIHQDIRRIFGSRLETMTDNNGAMIISAMAEKPTFYARDPVSASLRDKAHDNHQGDTRGKDQAKERGADQVNGRRNDGRSKAQIAGGRRGKATWEDHGGKFLHFTLYKENKDTMEAISWLSKKLRTTPRYFHFAGTKDRRAVTVQRVSVERILKNAIISAGRTLRNAHIGSLEYRPHPLQLGELNGNEFTITLRDCDFHYPVPLESELILEGARAIVSEAINDLSERGFINYYGLQRFGTYSIGTEIVGLKMLQGDFQGAVDAILTYSPASLAAALDPLSDSTDKVSMDDKARAYALHSYRTTDRPDQSLWGLPRRCSAESSIIRHLTGRPNQRKDYLGALQTINRNLRLMYVHAYQSLVWNSAVSERWKRFGSSLVEGDLVLVNDHMENSGGVIKNDDVDSDGEAIVRPGADDRAADPDDIFERARALTKTEAESGKYDIFDIVLPTPGFDIVYPPNEIGKFYEEFMASERGGGLDPHDMRRDWKDISLSGSYRKVLARPGQDFSFDVKAYKDENEQFVLTDMDRQRERNGEARQKQEDHADPNNAAGTPGTKQQDGAPTQKDDAINDNHGVSTAISEPTNVPHAHDNVTGVSTRIKSPSPESEDLDNGGVSLIGGAYRDYKIAVILKLQLSSSQYATMALRELMKSGGLKTWKSDYSAGR